MIYASGVCALRNSGERRGGGGMDVPTTVVSSRNSLVLKAAWRGPRRPMREMWRTAERRRTSSTGVGISYFARAMGGISSMHATSSATFSCLIMKTCPISWSGGGQGRDGYNVYQWNESEDDVVRRGGVRRGDGATGGEEV